MKKIEKTIQPKTKEKLKRIIDKTIKEKGNNANNSIYHKWCLSGYVKYKKPSIDHIIPKAKGGTNNLENLQFLSWFENRCKNDMTQSEWDILKSNIKEYFI